MANEIAKPDFSYQWSSGGAIVAPSNVKIQTGWTAEVPPFQWENYLQNRQDNAILHLFQKGISEWDAASNYYFTTSGVRSYVQGSDGVIYVAVADSIGQNPTTDVSDTYWKVAFADNSTALTTITGDARYTQRANNLSDLASAATARTNLGVADAVVAGVSGTALNLKMTAVGTNAVAVITADSICVKDSTAHQKVLNSVSIASLNLATNGVNGLDTGSMTANTWYATYIIYNPTTSTVAGLASLSYTAPTLPSGYTYSAFIGSVRVGTTNTRIWPMLRLGARTFLTPTAATDIPNDFLLVLASGTSTSTTAVSLQNFAPPSAKTARLGVSHGGGTTGFTSVMRGPTGAASGILAQANSNGTTTIRAQFDAPDPYNLGVYYAVGTAGAATILSMGWEE